VRSRYRLLLPEDGGGFVGRFWLDLSGITAAFKTSWSKDPRGKGELANDIRGCEAQRPEAEAFQVFSERRGSGAPVYRYSERRCRTDDEVEGKKRYEQA
jgi:hypothetical protein